MKKNKKNTPETEAGNVVDNQVDKNLPEVENEAEPEEAPEVDIEQLQAENQKLREDYLRAFAEAENKYAISSFGKNLLSVADNLHRAIEAVAKDDNKENCEALLKGVELTEAELMKVFNKFGISRMDIMGKVFDPNFHQVIQEVEDASKPAGTVIAELQTGYMLNDRLLREAMVVVTKGGPAAH